MWAPTRAVRGGGGWGATPGFVLTMTVCGVLPGSVEPDLVIELETITAMNSGSGPGGGFALLPGPVVQLVPHVTLGGFFSKPLNAAGALPPVRLFRLDHCAPQKVTEVPIAAWVSPIP